MEYLASVEEGLRAVAGRGLLGRLALKNPQCWEDDVVVVKKRACYTAVVRYRMKLPSLSTWKNYRWTDFTMCKKISKTFRTRHLPISNHKYWANKTQLVPAPTNWSLQQHDDVSTTRKTKSSPVPQEVITIWDSDDSDGGLSSVVSTTPVVDRTRITTRNKTPKPRRSPRKKIKNKNSGPTPPAKRTPPTATRRSPRKQKRKNKKKR